MKNIDNIERLNGTYSQHELCNDLVGCQSKLNDIFNVNFKRRKLDLYQILINTKRFYEPA